MVLGSALGTVFLLTGAGHAPASGGSALAGALGPFAGAPLLAVGGAILYVLGALVLGRPDEPGHAYHTREVVLSLSVAASAGLGCALALGIVRGWSVPTLAALGLGGGLETLLALVLVLRLSMAKTKRKLLFVPSTLGAVVLALLYLFVITLGTA
ncbi:hypothetical protein OAX78_04030 [Planctomycetota bacterium]|nr:hypothetical protein [Planctomycetota bacterium]